MAETDATAGDDVIAHRIAQQTLEARGSDYAGEVRRLLDAGREVMRACGTTSRPRVADIVAAAGLSNDAFYRHFASKDALVTAILDDGTERLRSYLDHQMAKAPGPEGKVRRWVEGVLAQAADPDSAATTLAVLWNSSGLRATATAPRHRPAPRWPPCCTTPSPRWAAPTPSSTRRSSATPWSVGSATPCGRAWARPGPTSTASSRSASPR